MNRYDYQQELAKAAGGTLVATAATGIAAAVVVDPALFEPVAYTGIILALGGLLVGDLVIRALTPDPFEEASQRFDEAYERFERNQQAQYHVPDDTWRGIEIDDSSENGGMSDRTER